MNGASYSRRRAGTMRSIPTDMWQATRLVLDPPNYKVGFAGLTVLLFAAYVFLPVWLTPGNDLSFQLSILLPRDYALFAALSGVTALLILMQIYVQIRVRKSRAALTAVGSSGVSLGSAIFGGLLATAACTSCIAALVGFLGAGSVFFVLEHQTPIVAGALVLVAIGLIYSARRVMGYCESCEINPIDQL